MDSAFIIEKSVVIVAVFALTMLMAMYSTWAERKVAAFLQDRVGPNRAGWGGLLQPLADGLKLFSKEEFEPNTPNKFLFVVGQLPCIFLVSVQDVKANIKPTTTQISTGKIGAFFISYIFQGLQSYPHLSV